MSPLRKRLLRLRVLQAFSGLLIACEASQPSATTVRGDTVIVTGRPMCEECRIDLELLAQIRSESEMAVLSHTGYIIRTGSGHFFVSGLYGHMGFAEFDPTGRFIRLHGNRGDGPGEYQRAALRLTPIANDSLLVFDSGLQRFSVLAPDGSFEYSFRAPFRIWDYKVGAGTIVASGSPALADPFELGPSAYVIRRDGTSGESVGPLLGPATGNSSTWTREVAVSASGAVALARLPRYEIFIRTSSGEELFLRREVDWFSPGDSLTGQQPQITQLWFDPEDRLWITVYVPDRRYTSLPVTRRISNDVEDYIRRADSILEVFDVDARALLASRRFDVPTGLYEGLVTQPHVAPNGSIQWKVFVPQLTRR
jgi:hypothetical protein